MAMEIRPISDSPDDREPDVVGTPEGDNELSPDQPLKPATTDATEGLEVPRGNKPDKYKRDHD